MTENWTKIYKQDEKSEQEEERKKNMMKERKKLRIWDPGWDNQLQSGCELDEWKVEK